MTWLADCRALDSRVWALAAARMVVTAGYSMVIPFLAMHLAVERHAGFVVVGTIWMVAGALGAISQWVAGELGDRLGRRPLMLAAMGARAVNLVAMGYAIASGPGQHEATVLVIGALTVANSVLRGFFDPVAAALVADLAPPRLRVAAYSLQRVGINVGWAAGPAIAALAASVPYSRLFYLSAPLTLLAAMGLLGIREPARARAAPAFTVAELLAFTRDRALLRFLLASLSFYLLHEQLYQTLSIYAAATLHLDRGAVGTLYTLNGLLVVLLQLPAVHFIHRLGTRGAVLCGSLGYTAGYVAVGLSHGQGGLLGCIGFITLAEILSAPAQQSAVTMLAPAGRLGAYTGLLGLTQLAGQSLGPLLGTTLLAAIAPRAAWFVLALFGVGAAVGYRGLGRSPRALHNPLAPEGQA